MLVPDNNPAQKSGSGPLGSVGSAGIPWREALVRAHREALAYCGPRHRELAEDVAQESLSKLFKNTGRVRVSWKAMLSKIVVNTARTRLKRDAARRARCWPDTAAVSAAPSEEPEPIDQAGWSEAAALLKPLLAQLDARFGRGTRAIVDFRAEGLPWEEIAGVVDLSERTCRYRHEKARAWLSERLALEAVKGGQRD
jgi:RNA polymerase sigma factor (sigma-70 family)